MVGVFCVMVGLLGVLVGVVGLSYWCTWCLWHRYVVFVTICIWDGLSGIFINKMCGFVFIISEHTLLKVVPLRSLWKKVYQLEKEHHRRWYHHGGSGD